MELTTIKAIKNYCVDLINANITIKDSTFSFNGKKCYLVIVTYYSPAWEDEVTEFFWATSY